MPRLRNSRAPGTALSGPWISQTHMTSLMPIHDQRRMHERGAGIWRNLWVSVRVITRSIECCDDIFVSVEVGGNKIVAGHACDDPLNASDDPLEDAHSAGQ